MSCESPNRAWRSRLGGMTFSKRLAIEPDVPVDLPCQGCPTCAGGHNRSFAIRALHENQFHDRSCVLTLTYANAPKSLVYRDFVLFAKRYRKFVEGIWPGRRIRIGYAGEYGDVSFRPHFHALVYGHDFCDKYFWRVSNSGTNLYRSKCLEFLWPHGHAEIGVLDEASAMYVTGYAIKKYANRGKSFYDRVCPLSGELFQLVPEKFNPPRGKEGGLGMPYFREYWEEILRRGDVVIDGQLTGAPKFYLSKLKQMAESDVGVAHRVDDLQFFLDSRRSGREYESSERLSVKGEVRRRRREFFKSNKRSL